MQSTEDLIQRVVNEVVTQLRGTSVSNASVAAGSATNAAAAAKKSPCGGSCGCSGKAGAHGVFGCVDEAVAASLQAFEKFQRCSIAQRKAATNKIREICIQQAERLGRLEYEETKIGRLDHKIEKMIVAGQESPGVDYLKAQLASGDRGMTVTDHAPFGVIAAITPVTHSLPTLANNAISMLAAGNTVVFNAHPSGANIAKEGVRLFNEAIFKEIGIDNLLAIIDPPTIESAQKLFDHRDVRLIVVTGGPAVARAALGSRKRAIVAGPGNPPVVVDETAYLRNAAESIVKGAAYDNNLLCIGEKEVFAVESIFDELMDAVASSGGYCLNATQVAELERAVFVKDPGAPGSGRMQKELIGKDPAVIAKAIGLSVPNGTQILFGETQETSPFVDHEQMMPFIPFVRTRNVDSGIELALEYEHGYRHTALIHSRNTDMISRMAREMDCTIFVANGPSMAGLGLGGEGYLSFSIATPTGEGVTTPLTFTRQRRLARIERQGE